MKYIITTNDFKPKPSTVEDWRLDAGKKLAEFIEKLTEKVVVVISGDLAHYHPTICQNQLYLPDPRFQFRLGHIFKEQVLSKLFKFEAKLSSEIISAGTNIICYFFVWCFTCFFQFSPQNVEATNPTV